MVVVETMKKHAYDTPPVYVTRAWSLSMIGRARAVLPVTQLLEVELQDELDVFR